MKPLSTLLLTFLFTLALSAQITINPDVIAFQTDGEMINVKINVTNNSNDYTDIYWKFVPAENFPAEWGITVCDDETCYLENIIQCSPGGPNDMTAGYDFDFKFTINPNGVEGTSYGILYLYDDSKFENEVAVSSAPITFVSDDVICLVFRLSRRSTNIDDRIRNSEGSKTQAVGATRGATSRPANAVGILSQLNRQSRSPRVLCRSCTAQFR